MPRTDEWIYSLEQAHDGLTAEQYKDLFDAMQVDGFQSRRFLNFVGIPEQEEFYTRFFGAAAGGYDFNEYLNATPQQKDDLAALYHEALEIAFDEGRFWDTILHLPKITELEHGIFEIEAPQIPEDMEEDDVEPPIKLAPGFQIAAAFNGTKQIIEFENDRVYCPSGEHCIFKCIEKYFDLEYNTVITFDRSTHTAAPTITKFRSKLVEKLAEPLIDRNGVPRKYEIENTPRVYTIKRIETPKANGQGQINDRLPIAEEYEDDPKRIARFKRLQNYEFLRGNSHEVHTVKKYCIALMPVKVSTDTSNSYHAILIKNPELHGGNISLKKLTENFPFYYDCMKLSIVKTLTDATIPISKKMPTYCDPAIFAFDYETMHGERRRQVPAGVSIINFKLETGADEHITLNNVMAFTGPECTNLMLNYIILKCVELGKKQAQVYSHNGGCFDTIIMKGNALGITWLNQYGTGSNIKCLEGSVKLNPYTEVVYAEGEVSTQIGKINIKFKDSAAFIPMALKKCVKKFGIFEKYKIKKIELDIAGKSAEWYDRNTRIWIPYMKVDSLALALVLFTFEKTARRIGQSILNTSGTPSMAQASGSLMSAIEYQRARVHKGVVNCLFVKESQYGGRILHWLKEFRAAGLPNPTLFNGHPSRGMICLDANSLYPFAMANFDYPYGDPIPFNTEMTPFEFTMFYSTTTTDGMYIAEVDVDMGNVKYPLAPYRNKSGNLLYMAGKFRGVYCSIDIAEIKKMGGTISRYYRGFIYTKKCAMFANWVEPLYALRCENKKTPLDESIKLILNGFYGKLSEMIDEFTSFSEEVNETFQLTKSVKLVNGQTERHYKQNNPSPKNPHHIGAFVLAYARAHMNRLILGVGPENIAYGDTDSIYVTVEAWEAFRDANPEYVDKTKLGGFKNDYTAAVKSHELLIKEAYFIDLKRYLLIFNEPDEDGNLFKVKFVGVKFTHNPSIIDSIANYFDDMGKPYITDPRDIKRLNELYNNYIEYQTRYTVEYFIEKFIYPYEIHIRNCFLEHYNKLKETTTATFAMNNGSLGHNDLKNLTALFKEFLKMTMKESTVVPISLAMTKFKRIMDGVHIDHATAKFVACPSRRNTWDGFDRLPFQYDTSIPEHVLPRSIMGYERTLTAGYAQRTGATHKINLTAPFASTRARVIANVPADATNFILAADGRIFKLVELRQKNAEPIRKFYEFTGAGLIAAPKEELLIDRTPGGKALISLRASDSLFGVKVEDPTDISKKVQALHKTHEVRVAREAKEAAKEAAKKKALDTIQQLAAELVQAQNAYVDDFGIDSDGDEYIAQE